MGRKQKWQKNAGHFDQTILLKDYFRKMFIVVVKFYEYYHPILLSLFSLTLQKRHTQVCSVMGGVLCCCCCDKSIEEQNAQLTDVILSRQPPSSVQCRGNLLVFINPHSGRGKSLETFVHTVAPRLDKNLIRYEVVITTGPNHAKTYLSTKNDLGKFNGIVILSGDGLVFEALNGIYSRDDAFQMFPSIPIGVIPSGSGNGLLSSVLAKYNESLDPKKVLTRSIEFVTSPTAKSESVAILSVQTDTADLVGFLSIGWGLMADIDIESEKWRKPLGAHRFTLSGFIRSANLRSYRGKLVYRPYKKHDFVIDEKKIDVYANTTQERIAKIGEKTTGWIKHDGDEENPEDLVVIEDDFINVYAVTVSHIACDGPFAPDAELADNRIYLSYILKHDVPTRVDIAKYLLSIEHQKHLELPFVKVVEVSSLSLDVITDGSYVVVDGEVVDTKSLKVTTTRNNMSVFSPTTTTTTTNTL